MFTVLLVSLNYLPCFTMPYPLPPCLQFIVVFLSQQLYVTFDDLLMKSVRGVLMSV